MERKKRKNEVKLNIKGKSIKRTLRLCPLLKRLCLFFTSQALTSATSNHTRRGSIVQGQSLRFSFRYPGFESRHHKLIKYAADSEDRMNIKQKDKHCLLNTAGKP